MGVTYKVLRKEERMDANRPRDRLSRAAFFILLFVIILATFSCNLTSGYVPLTGSGEPQSDKETANPQENPPFNSLMPPANNFITDRANLTAGECARLSWDIQDVEIVELNGKSVARKDSVEVCPTVTTTYTLKGLAGGGPPKVEESIVIKITGSQPPVIIHTQAVENPVIPAMVPTKTQATNLCAGKPVIAYFNANPSTVDAGQSVVLSWDAFTNSPANALSHVILNNGIGSVGGIDKHTVNPSATTTYTLTADGCGGFVNKTVTVTVNQPQAAPPGGGSAGVLTADLAITDLFPDNWPNGMIFARITNNGPGSPSNSAVQISCEGSSHAYSDNSITPISSSDALTISQAPGITTAYSTGISTLGVAFWYDVTCTINPSFKDTNSGNNKYSEKFPAP
jgi:hypothetical protein